VFTAGTPISTIAAFIRSCVASAEQSRAAKEAP